MKKVKFFISVLFALGILCGGIPSQAELIFDDGSLIAVILDPTTGLNDIMVCYANRSNCSEKIGNRQFSKAEINKAIQQINGSEYLGQRMSKRLLLPGCAITGVIVGVLGGGLGGLVVGCAVGGAVGYFVLPHLQKDTYHALVRRGLDPEVDLPIQQVSLIGYMEVPFDYVKDALTAYLPQN